MLPVHLLRGGVQRFRESERVGAVVPVFSCRIAIRPNNFQIYFTLALGSLSVGLLVITIATWKVYPSFSVPADIMFAICWA